MSVFVKIEKGRYIDSLETLFAMTVLMEQAGVNNGYAGVASNVFKEDVTAAGLGIPELDSATANDFVIVADCDSKASFDAAVAAVYGSFQTEGSAQVEESFVSTKAAVQKHP